MNLAQRTKKALHDSVDREGSQANLARKTGVSTSVINLFYGGRRDVANMPLDTLDRLFPDMAVSFFKDQPMRRSGEAEGLPPVNTDDYTKLILKELAEMSVHQKIQVLADIAKVKNPPAPPIPAEVPLENEDVKKATG